MKNLTFNITCSLLFRLEQGTRRDELMECFEKMIAGKWSVPPVNLPFTPNNRSIMESKKVQHMIKEFISEKRAELKQKNASPLQALVACWLNIRNDDNEEALIEMRTCTISFSSCSQSMTLPSVVITFLLRALANEPAVYAALPQGIFTFAEECRVPHRQKPEFPLLITSRFLYKTPHIDVD